MISYGAGRAMWLGGEAKRFAKFCTAKAKGGTHGYARTGSDMVGTSGWWYAGAACVDMWLKWGRGKERMMVDRADLRW